MLETEQNIFKLDKLKANGQMNNVKNKNQLDTTVYEVLY
jgi:hypothetical protein